MEERGEIASQLVHLQERYDLSQVAIANFHMRRIGDLAGKMVGLEGQLFNADGEMNADVPMDLRIKVYQEIAKQLHLSTSFVDGKATTPTVSSPERMERVANRPDETDEKVKQLPPESRRKVLALLRRMEALPALPG